MRDMLNAEIDKIVQAAGSSRKAFEMWVRDITAAIEEGFCYSGKHLYPCIGMDNVGHISLVFTTDKREKGTHVSPERTHQLAMYHYLVEMYMLDGVAKLNATWPFFDIPIGSLEDMLASLSKKLALHVASTRIAELRV